MDTHRAGIRVYRAMTRYVATSPEAQEHATNHFKHFMEQVL